MGGGEGKLVGVAHQGAVVVGASGVEPAACEADGIGGGGGEVAGQVEAGVGAKDDAAGVHQEQVGVAAADLDQAVDQGGVVADDATEDVLGLRIGEEVGDLVLAEAEFLEAVELVGSVAGEMTAADVDAVAVGRDQGVAARSGLNGLGTDRENRGQTQKRQSQPEQAMGRQGNQVRGQKR